VLPYISEAMVHLVSDKIHWELQYFPGNTVTLLH